MSANFWGEREIESSKLRGGFPSERKKDVKGTPGALDSDDNDRNKNERKKWRKVVPFRSLPQSPLPKRIRMFLCADPWNF